MREVDLVYHEHHSVGESFYWAGLIFLQPSDSKLHFGAKLKLGCEITKFAGIGFIAVGLYVKLEAEGYEEFLGGLFAANAIK